jgi:hypothetical protein
MLQFAGFWMALATFLGIWWGHVGVRWLEAHSRSIWPPLIVLVVVGVGLNIAALLMPSILPNASADLLLTLSGVASIIGITLMWDGLEMYRQQNRIKKGHAPANPANPRHAAYLAAGMGTTEDLLNREPQGYPVNMPTPHHPVPHHPVPAERHSVIAQREYAEVESA